MNTKHTPPIVLAQLPRHGLKAKTLCDHALGLRLMSIHLAWLMMAYDHGFLLLGAICAGALEAVLWFGLRQRAMNGDGLAVYVNTALAMGPASLGAMSAMLLAISSWGSPVGYAIIAAIVITVEIGSWHRAMSLDMPKIFNQAKRKKVLEQSEDGWVFNLWDIELLTTNYHGEPLYGKIVRYWLPMACISLIPVANIQIYNVGNIELAAGIASIIALGLAVASQNSSYFIHATYQLFAQVRKQG